MRRSSFSGIGLVPSRRCVDSKTQENLLKFWLGSLALVAFGYFYIIYHHQWSYLFAVVTRTLPLWIVFGCLAAFGAWCWKKNEEFSKRELGWFLAIGLFVTYPAVAYGFWWLTDLGDTEVWNGKAMKIVKTDRYYTEDKDHDKTWYGPYYRLYTNNDREEIDLSEGELERWVALWGGWGRQTTSPILLADGPAGVREHTVTWDGRSETSIPVSVEHPYVNFIRASNGVLRTQGAIGGFGEFLKPYPRVHGGNYGKIHFDRVVCANATLDPNFAETVDSHLDEALKDLAKVKQVNVLVYVAGTNDTAFYYALEDFWRMGKNNDVVVVIGYTNNHIDWCQTLTWTKHELFKEQMQDEVRGLKTLSGKGRELAEIIVKHISSKDDAGFQRPPMSDYTFMAGEVSLPIWAYLIVILGAVLLSVPTVIWFCNN